MSIEQRDQLVIIDHGEGDEPLSNRQMNRLFSSVLEARLARRQLLKGSAGAAALGFFGLGLAGCKSSSSSTTMAARRHPLRCWAFPPLLSAAQTRLSFRRATATR